MIMTIAIIMMNIFFVVDDDYENGDGEDYCLDNVIAALNIEILKCNRVSPQQLVCILKGNGITICKIFWIISYFVCGNLWHKCDSEEAT